MVEKIFDELRRLNAVISWRLLKEERLEFTQDDIESALKENLGIIGQHSEAVKFQLS